MTTQSFNIYQQLTSVRVYETSNINAVYNNGPLNNGVNSTLTAIAPGLLVLDSVTLNRGDRVLIGGQTDARENGIYEVIDAGSPTTNWELKRPQDYQSIEQLRPGMYFSVSAGATQAGAMLVLIEPLPPQVGAVGSTFNFVDVSQGGGGPYLTVAGNLNDIANNDIAFSNLGLGSAQADTIVQLTDVDFPGGVLQLANPCPNYISLLCNNPGNVLRLPPADEDDAYALSQGPVVRNFVGFQDVDVESATGTPLVTMDPPDNIQFLSTDNTTPNGSWFQYRVVNTVNGVSGDVTIPVGGASPAQLVYVANDGSDITGDGTIGNAYQTIEFALSQIVDNTSAKPYTIIAATGVYNETDIPLKPYIHIDGNNSILNITNPMGLDAGWSAGGLCVVKNFTECTFNATLDLAGVTAPSGVIVFNQMNFNAAALLTLTGNSAAHVFVMQNLTGGASGSPTLLANNCALNTFEGMVDGVTYNHTLGGPSLNLNMFNTALSGTVAIISAGAGVTTTALLKNITTNLPAAFVQSGGAALVTTTQFSSFDQGVTVDGSLWITDNITTTLPTLLNGGSYQLSNLADGMNANYTPSNYTPTDNSVKGNLEGIDNALAVAVSSPEQFVYVSQDGNDVVGGGAITAPYASVEFALSQITDNAGSKPYTIYVTTGQYNETTINLKPFVHINYNNSDVTVTNPIGIDASWTATGVCVFQNVEDANFDMDLDLDAAGATTSSLMLRNITYRSGAQDLEVTGTGTANHRVIMDNINGLTFAACDVNTTNLNVVMEQCLLNTYDHINSTAGSTDLITVNNCTLSGNSSFTSTAGTALVNASLSNCILDDVLGTAVVDGETTLTVTNATYTPGGQLLLNNTTLFVDQFNEAIVIILGSTINLVRIADSLNANYTPTNYIPTDGSVKGNLEGIDNALGAGFSSAQQFVYVAQDGADVVGGGTVGSPYATVAFAMSQITDAALTKPYTIYVATGAYNEANLTLKPFVYINYNNSVVNFTNPVLIDAGWVAGGQAIIENVGNGDFSVNFDFNSFAPAAACSIILRNINYTSSQTVVATGTLGQSHVVLMRNCFSDTTPPDVTGSNVNLIIQDCVLDTLAPTTSGAGATALEVKGSTIEGLTNITAIAATSTVNATLINSKFEDDINSSANTLGTLTLNVEGCIFVNAAVLNINDTDLFVDQLNLPINDTPPNNITLTRIADGLNANYTPVNYVAATPSVQSNLAGIDTALGDLTTAQQFVYVDNQGSDVTGTGSFTNPYQTIEFAMSQITDNSAAKPYGIVCVPGTYNETNLVIKNNVSLYGNESRVFVTNQVTLDADWSGSGTSFITFFGFNLLNFSAGALFDVAALGVPPSAAFYFDNVGLSGAAAALIGIVGTVTPITTLNLSNITGAPRFNITAVLNGVVRNSLLGIFTYTKTGAGAFTYNITGCVFTDTVTLNSNNGTLNGEIIGCSCQSVVMNSNGGGVLNYNWTGSSYTSFTVVNNGVSATVAFDQIQGSPNLVNGATATFPSIADGLTANYTPVNYTPDDASVRGNLEGIDNALGALQLSGFVPEYVSGTTLNLNPGVCQDSTGVFTLELSAVALLDITNIGVVNGLDAGAAAIDTWYAVHVIADSAGVNPTGGLLSLSDTAPILPAGYDIFRRAGWVFNATVLLEYWCQGEGTTKRYTITDDSALTNILTLGNATVFTTLDASFGIPPTSRYGTMACIYDPSNTAHFLDIRPLGSTIAFGSNLCSVAPGGGGPMRVSIPFVTDANQMIQYQVSTAGNDATLSIYEYVDNV